MQPIETERLLMRPFETEDLEAIQEQVWADPAVAGPFAGKMRTIEETRQWLIARIWEGKGDEGGYYAVVRKADTQLIGLFTLSLFLAHFLRLEGDPPSPFNSLEVELGYAIGRRYQRQGYATEAGRCLIDYAFKHLKLRRLISGADERKNPASYHLAMKLGFQAVRNLHPKWPGMTCVLYNRG
jgi:ribosomal-protein-alanine N-acetyltransferase